MDWCRCEFRSIMINLLSNCYGASACGLVRIWPHQCMQVLCMPLTVMVDNVAVRFYVCLHYSTEIHEFMFRV